MNSVGIKMNGHVAPGFEGVAAQFTRNFEERGETGAAFAAVQDGEIVVDLWGGLADTAEQRPWEQDTIAVILSGTKGLVALCMHMLADRGKLDLDEPVCSYWPEFATRGKQAVRVMDVLTHTARLPGLRTTVTPTDLTDDARLARLLAEQPQETAPVAWFCYHALTYGWLCGEIIRRIDGRSVGQFFADEVADPLDLDCWIGLPADLEQRVARLELGPASGVVPPFDPRARADDALFQAVWGNPPMFYEPLLLNRPELHRAEIPGVGAIASAKAIATLYGTLACGGSTNDVRLLSWESLAHARTRQVCAYDDFTDDLKAFALGFQVQSPTTMAMGPPPDAFGHEGAGGSRHGAWPTERVGFSYVMNQLRDEPDERASSLLASLHAAAVANQGRPKMRERS